MPQQSQSFDLRQTLEGIANAVKSRVEDFAGKTAAGVASPSGEALESAVLASLEGKPKNAHQVLEALQLNSAGSLRTSAGAIQQTLNELTARELAKAKPKGDRKVYSLTSAGEEALLAAKAKMTDAQNADTSAPRAATIKMSFDTKFLAATTKLAPVLLDIAQTGTREQQAQATKVLEQARKQLHVILAAD